MTLSAADRRLIDSSPFDDGATPAYNEITGALAWPDEVPDGLSQAGHGILRDLLATRGYLHRGLPVERERWDDVVASGLRWNGFRRVALTPDQQALFERYLADAEL